VVTKKILKLKGGLRRRRPMLRSGGLGRLMNPRRTPLILATAVGVVVAAPIGLAPPAGADTDDPFQALFGDTGINTWTVAADNSLNSSDPTLAADLNTSVDNFLADVPISAQFPDGDDPFSFITWEVDPSTFTADPTLAGGLPDNALGDSAVALDYTLFASGLGGNDVGIADSLNFLANLPDAAAGWILALLLFPEDLLLIPILAAA
jgi:hypothetical protein